MSGIIHYWNYYKEKIYGGDKMDAAVNDLSFDRVFSNKIEAVQKVRQWMNICKIIESQETTAIESIYSVKLNTSKEIAPDYPFIQLVREFETRDEQRYLIHLLTNLNQPEDMMDQEPFYLGNKCSQICSWARDKIIVSMESDVMFEQSILNGRVKQEKVSIKNISKEAHIQLHEEFLGIRHYEANKKHGNRPYINAAGRYVDAMDLNDTEAQKLLNHAIEIDGKLYGKRKGKYYCFQKHLNNYYHGYQNNELGLHIRKRIDEENWE